MIKNEATVDRLMSLAVDHIAGFTEYCSKCGRFVISDCDIPHACEPNAQVEKHFDADCTASCGNALFGATAKGISFWDNDAEHNYLKDNKRRIE